MMMFEIPERENHMLCAANAFEKVSRPKTRYCQIGINIT